MKVAAHFFLCDQIVFFPQPILICCLPFACHCSFCSHLPVSLFFFSNADIKSQSFFACCFFFFSCAFFVVFVFFSHALFIMTTRTAVSSVANKALTDAAAALLSSADFRNGGGASVTLPKVCSFFFIPVFVLSFSSQTHDTTAQHHNTTHLSRVSARHITAALGSCHACSTGRSNHTACRGSSSNSSNS